MPKSSNAIPLQAQGFNHGFGDSRMKRAWKPKSANPDYHKGYKEGWLMAGGKLPKVSA